MKLHFRLATVAFALVASFSIGCGVSLQDRHTEFADPCWPERYDAQARASVRDTMAAQIANGREVDNALYNFHFEAGSAELNPAGRAKLDYILRRRPAVDGRINLQTARDISYDAAKPDALVNGRAELDAKRINSIQQYVMASTSGRNVAVDVTVRDLPDLSIDSAGPATSVRGLTLLYASTINGVSGGGMIGGAGGGAAPVGAAAAGGVPGGAPAGGQAPPR